MTIELYDLGQRLAAAAQGRPVARAAYAPVLPPSDAVAVTITGRGRHLRVDAATSDRTAQGHGPRALAALTALGVTVTGTHRTLVVPDRPTLTTLAALAQNTDPDSPAAAAAAVVAWWDQRADHAGTGAVLVTTDACRARWVLGTTPDAEHLPAVWLAALGVTTPRGTSAGRQDTHAVTPGALLTLARIVASGHTLPRLLDVHGQDTRSWKYHLDRIATGRDWRRRDSATEAALGLASREDANELYASLRLGDPLVAQRERYTGTVVSGHVLPPGDGCLTVDSDLLVCRMRAGQRVIGWIGGPLANPGVLAKSSVRGVVDEVSVSASGHLRVRLRDVVQHPRPIAAGTALTLRPALVEVNAQQWGRATLSDRYSRAGNWIASSVTPPRPSRTVPLDVLVLSADD